MSTSRSDEGAVPADSSRRGIHPVLIDQRNGSTLFIGTQKAAQDAELLRKHDVRKIICVGTPAFHQDCNDFVYLAIPVLDLPSENLLVHLDRCVSFIEEGMQQGQGILVNCVFAQSRSASGEKMFPCAVQSFDREARA